MLRDVIVLHPLLPSQRGADNKFTASIETIEDLVSSIDNHFAILKANPKWCNPREYSCTIQDHTTKERLKLDPSLNENYILTDFDLEEGGEFPFPNAAKISLIFSQIKADSGWDTIDEETLNLVIDKLSKPETSIVTPYIKSEGITEVVKSVAGNYTSQEVGHSKNLLDTVDNDF